LYALARYVERNPLLAHSAVTGWILAPAAAAGRLKAAESSCGLFSIRVLAYFPKISVPFGASAGNIDGVEELIPTHG
jgi:hypothetical protein